MQKDLPLKVAKTLRFCCYLSVTPPLLHSKPTITKELDLSNATITSCLKVNIEIVVMANRLLRLLLQRLPKPAFLPNRWKSQIFSPRSLTLKLDHWQRTHLNIIIPNPNNSNSYLSPPSYYIMGSSQNSDSRVKLYIELATPVIYAGQYLEGTAHLQVIGDTSYSQLLISLNGEEEVCWSQRSEKIISSIKNSRKTYSEEFVLRRFEGGLKRGHYSFPFSMLLPSTLPATAQISPRNSISFLLSISLPAETDKGQAQSYNVSLNVREPLRLLTSTSQYGTATSDCWKCMGTKTSGIFHIEVDKNEVRYGEPFKIRGFIDNANGQFSIDQFCVLLTKRVTKVGQNGKVKVKSKDLCELVKPKTGVKVGLQKKFQAEVTLPKEIKEHTAIGNIISRCYYLTFVGEVGCCYSDTRIEKHIHVNNDLPNTEQQPPTPPNDWNPKVYPDATFISLKPYLYQPCSELKIFNQKGSGMFPSIYNPTTSQNMIKMGQ